jgi:hypothetical protein
LQSRKKLVKRKPKNKHIKSIFAEKQPAKPVKIQRFGNSEFL